MNDHDEPTTVDSLEDEEPQPEPDLPGAQAAEARLAIRRAQAALEEALQAMRPPRGLRDEGGD